MLRRFLILLTMLSCAPSFEEALGASLELHGTTTRVELNAHLEIMRDPGGELSFEEVRTDGMFSPLNASTLNLGITNDACWVRTQVLNRSKDTDWVLEVASASRLIELYIERASGEVIRSSSGDRLPFAQRHVAFRNTNFKVSPPRRKCDALAEVRPQCFANTSSASEVGLERIRRSHLDLASIMVCSLWFWPLISS